MSRSIMQLRLPAAVPSTLPQDGLRSVSPDDTAGLAELMLAAYAGTIDDEGGTLSDAQQEVKRLFSGAYGTFLPDVSRVAVKENRLVSAALITLYGKENQPFLAFSMTAPECKRQGLARKTLLAAIQALNQTEAQELTLVVTDGNTPAVTLYQQLGFLPRHARNK